MLLKFHKVWWFSDESMMMRIIKSKQEVVIFVMELWTKKIQMQSMRFFALLWWEVWKQRVRCFFVLKQGGIWKSGWGSDNVYGFWFRVGGFVVKEYREQGQQWWQGGGQEIHYQGARTGTVSWVFPLLLCWFYNWRKIGVWEYFPCDMSSGDISVFTLM